MLIPVNHVLGVCAVLILSNKRDTDGLLQPFIEHDLAIANLTSTILLNHFQIKKAKNCNESDALNIPLTLNTMNAIKFNQSQ